MKNSSRNPIDKKPRRFPVIQETALEELAGHLDARQRRVLARRFERWAAQLVLSAKMIETANQQGLTAGLDEIVCEDEKWPELKGKTPIESLTEVAQLEDRCHRIRLGLAIAGIITPDEDQTARRLFIFQN